MQIEYDKKSDAKYIRLKKGNVAETKEKQKWLLFDYDKNGEVLGVEILDASKHPISLSTIGGKFLGYQDVKFSPLGPGDENVSLIIRSQGLRKSLQFVS